MKIKKEVDVSNYVIYLRAIWISLVSQPDLICCGAASWFSVLLNIPRAVCNIGQFLFFLTCWLLRAVSEWNLASFCLSLTKAIKRNRNRNMGV